MHVVFLMPPSHLPALTRQRGQVLAGGVLLVLVCLAGLGLMYYGGRLMLEKTKLVNTADAAAYGAAELQAQGLNFISHGNIALMSLEMLAMRRAVLGQMPVEDASTMAALRQVQRSVDHGVAKASAQRMRDIIEQRYGNDGATTLSIRSHEPVDWREAAGDAWRSDAGSDSTAVFACMSTQAPARYELQRAFTLRLRHRTVPGAAVLASASIAFDLEERAGSCPSWLRRFNPSWRPQLIPTPPQLLAAGVRGELP